MDPGQWGPRAVAVMDKFTRTTEILWRKKEVRERARGPERAQERARPLPGQAFLGALHQGWSSFTMHRFTVGDYLLQTAKDRMLLITSKRRMLQLKGASG